MSNYIATVSDIPVRWFSVSIRGGQKFEVDEATAEEIIKSDKIIVLRDKNHRLVRYINKADISDIAWDKNLTKENYQRQLK
jgi:hypothetical protein